MIIGEKVRLARLFRGYSQENMATILKVSTTAYRKMEKSLNLSEQRIQQIAQILDMPEEELKAIGEKGFFNSFNSNPDSILYSQVEGYTEKLITQIELKYLELRNKDLEVENLKLKNELLEQKLRQLNS